MITIPQQLYMIDILMREARRLARDREWLVVPMFALLLRRLGMRFNFIG